MGELTIDFEFKISGWILLVHFLLFYFFYFYFFFSRLWVEVLFVVIFYRPSREGNWEVELLKFHYLLYHHHFTDIKKLWLYVTTERRGINLIYNRMYFEKGDQRIQWLWRTVPNVEETFVSIILKKKYEFMYKYVHYVIFL